MEKRFTIQMAGLSVRLSHRYAHVRTLCRDYIVDEPEMGADICVSTTPEEIAKECARATDEPLPPAHAEALCLYRAIAEQLPAYDRMVFHGAAIEWQGRAYLFAAPSGTGKSTHVALWRRYLGEAVRVINGDKPVLHVTEQGITVYSTPWAGKEDWKTNSHAPLDALCLLRRGEVNRLEMLDVQHSPELLLRQIYMPKQPLGAIQTLELTDRLCRLSRCVALYCDISQTAVQVCFEGLTGQPFVSTVDGSHMNG